MRLTIERMTYGSSALSHDATGKAIFVANAAPGDVVEAEIVASAPSYDRARIVSVIEPGAGRNKPACPYADICGGCPWAHLTREAQLAAKRTCVVDALSRIGHFEPKAGDAMVDACVDLGHDLHYRNKVELGVSQSAGKTAIGMHACGSRSLVKIDACPLLGTRNPKLINGVSGALAFLANSRDLGLIRVGIRSSRRTNDLEVALWTTPGPFPRAQASKLIGDATGGHASSIVRVLAKGPAKARRVTGVERLAGKGFWEERIGNETMRFSAPSFFQVNTIGAEKLVALAMDMLDPSPQESAMDLYCGAGTFTLPLARRTSWVDAVEAAGSAVRDLRRNLDVADIGNVYAIGGDVERELLDANADVVLVDPPRAGLSAKTVAILSEMGARAIVYVSCDPATLARDLARFQSQGAFVPTRITPVDLFPQTYHVETVVLMSRAKD